MHPFSEQATHARNIQFAELPWVASGQLVNANLRFHEICLGLQSVRLWPCDVVKQVPRFRMEKSKVSDHWMPGSVVHSRYTTFTRHSVCRKRRACFIRQGAQYSRMRLGNPKIGCIAVAHRKKARSLMPLRGNAAKTRFHCIGRPVSVTNMQVCNRRRNQRIHSTTKGAPTYGRLLFARVCASLLNARGSYDKIARGLGVF